MKNIALLLFMLAVSGSVFAQNLGQPPQKQPKVIYGQDNRLDYSDTTDVRKLLADSTVAMVPKRNLNGSSRYNYVCSDEVFHNQRTLATCSGFLVAPNKIATAGHCIETQADCEDNLWVFNYNDQNPQMDSRDVYRCKKILGRHLDGQIDYAVIELTKANPHVEPLTMATTPPEKGDPVFVIGHPVGLPVKIADGATVRSTNFNFFLATLDTYGGNSGSPVFNKNDEVQGILVRGYTDFQYDSSSRCQRSMRCLDTDCSGEGVTHIKYVNQILGQ